MQEILSQISPGGIWDLAMKFLSLGKTFVEFIIRILSGLNIGIREDQLKVLFTIISMLVFYFLLKAKKFALKWLLIIFIVWFIIGFLL